MEVMAKVRNHDVGLKACMCVCYPFQTSAMEGGESPTTVCRGWTAQGRSKHCLLEAATARGRRREPARPLPDCRDGNHEPAHRNTWAYIQKHV